MRRLRRIFTLITVLASSPALPSAAHHFSETELQALGCKVLGARTRLQHNNLPLVGKVENFTLKSQRGCKIKLASQLRHSPKYDAASWAGLRSGLAVLSKRQRFDLTISTGLLGEHSEIHHFSRHGIPQGFGYIIQYRDMLYLLTVLGTHPFDIKQVTTMIKSRLDLASDNIHSAIPSR